MRLDFYMVAWLQNFLIQHPISFSQHLHQRWMLRLGWLALFQEA